MTLFRDKSGLVIDWDLDVIEFRGKAEYIRWRMSRTELLRFGLRAVWCAVFRRDAAR